MWTKTVVTVTSLTILACLGQAQSVQRRAVLSGGGNADRGKCTIEVVVDGAAEVEVRGDSASLRTLNGQSAQWRRFQCTSVMPSNPGGFRFEGVDGRGRQDLVRDPRQGGVAVVRLEDPDGGREGYTFDLVWDRAYASGPGQWGERDRVGRPGRMSTRDAVRVCQDSIRAQAANQFHTNNIAFRNTDIDNNPGRRDWVVGTFDVRRGFNREDTYGFSCSVDFDNGQVRSANIELNEGRQFPGTATGAGVAIQSCQNAVEQRLRNNGYGRVDVGSIDVDNNVGRRDRVVGFARAFGRRGSDSFEFSCSVNLASGTVRNVDVTRR